MEDRLGGVEGEKDGGLLGNGVRSRFQNMKCEHVMTIGSLWLKMDITFL